MDPSDNSAISAAGSILSRISWYPPGNFNGGERGSANLTCYWVDSERFYREFNKENEDQPEEEA